MDEDRSITTWVADLRLGDGAPAVAEAQDALWDRYFRRLMALAKTKLGGAPRGIADEEDIALAALQSFFAGAAAGAFPKLSDRDSLWPLLAKITANKAIDHRRRVTAMKKGGGRVRGDSAFLGVGDAAAAYPDALIEQELGPEALAEFSEQCERLMGALRDDQMRAIARMKLEGRSNREVASELGVVERTIERRLALIREIWTAHLQA